MNILFIILLGVLVNQDNSPLNTFKWKNRILIIQQQEEFFQTMKTKVKELKDRDMIIIHIQDDHLYSFPQSLNLDSKEVTNYFGFEKNNSYVILIGKDGGIKLNKASTSCNEIFDLIDSMPMRQSEMRKKSGK
ncbi:MAG: DUF4174 domain-containing protein [Saprospiraceae bacterium]|nr:DUF4174 domain-containing protein [Saprospiraceae bacterium]